LLVDDGDEVGWKLASQVNVFEHLRLVVHGKNYYRILYGNSGMVEPSPPNWRELEELDELKKVGEVERNVIFDVGE